MSYIRCNYCCNVTRCKGLHVVNKYRDQKTNVAYKFKGGAREITCEHGRQLTITALLCKSRTKGLGLWARGDSIICCYRMLHILRGMKRPQLLAAFLAALIVGAAKAPPVEVRGPNRSRLRWNYGSAHRPGGICCMGRWAQRLPPGLCLRRAESQAGF